MQAYVKLRRGGLVAVIAALLLATACSDTIPPDMLERSRATPPWFDDAKLGIFIHWGPASVPAFAAGEPLQPGELEELLLSDGPRRELPYAEWYLNSMSFPGSPTALHHAKTYGDAPYTDFKKPFEENVNEGWDPQAWADLFAKAGAKYVVLVTKHHDGYTLWPSQVKNPNRDNWGSPRDMVGELAAAVRARGMAFGTYYSTGLDWTFKMITEEDWVRGLMRSAPSSQAYADYVYDHIVELIDRYQPDLLWADIGYPAKGRQGDLFRYYYSKVPEGAVNDRWAPVDALGEIAELPGATWVLKSMAHWLIANKPDPLLDDPERVGFKTAEYDSLPGIAPFKWEATRGLGGSFAFNANETSDDMLTAPQLIQFVTDTVAKNGNVLINVGPDSYGRIPAMQQAPLLGLGEWLQTNGEALYGTRPWTRFENRVGRELRYTQNDDALYAIVSGEVAETFTIESPDVEWTKLDVLGATVLNTQKADGLLNITLAQPISSPAVVVRFSRR